jgi:hypothetical protein
MDDPYNLFTTASPTAALPWSTPSAVARELVGAVGTATAAVAFAAVVAAMTSFPIVPRVGAEIDAVINLDSDPLVESVWRVESDGARIEEAARHAATEALVALREVGLTPERVLADPDGGVALYVFGDETIEGGARARYVRVAASNDETLTVLCVDRETSERTAWDASSDLGASLVRVAEFLG